MKETFMNRYVMRFNASNLCLAVMSFVFCACNLVPKQASQEVKPETSEKGIVILPAGYPEEKDTLTLSEWADTVFYVRLQQPGLTDDCQVHYLDSLILMYDHRDVMAFDAEGKPLYRIAGEAGCLDVLPEEASFYLYHFSDRIIRKYGFDGKERATLRLKAEMGTYGRNFLALSDTLFAISTMNVGYNPYELFFVDGRGEVVHRVKNREPFQPQTGSRTHNSVWHHRLFRSDEGCRYYPSYADTLYEVREDATIHPVMVENKISKIPLEHRLEYSGQRLDEFIQEMLDRGWNAVRHFETSRFHLAEYKIGGYAQMLSNYLIFDKESGKLYRTSFQLLDALKGEGPLHFGIFNDYDGGLAFAPSSQSGEYLVMVNAGGQQGGYHTRPRTLFQEGRVNTGKAFQVRSDVWTDSSHRQRLERFFQDFDEKKHSMLMMVKPKK